MQTQKILMTAALSVILQFAAPASAGPEGSAASIAASGLSAKGSAKIVEGSFMSIEGSGAFVVTSLETAGETVNVVLQGSAEIGRVVVALPVALVGGAFYAVGQTITVIAESAGWVLTQGGKALAFIPNELGNDLLHSRVVTNGSI